MLSSKYNIFVWTINTLVLVIYSHFHFDTWPSRITGARYDQIVYRTDRQIFIAPELSKVFGSLVSVRLGGITDVRRVLPTTQFVYRNSLDTCDALLFISYTLQSALESGQEAKFVQIDFIAAFDGVDLQGILIKLRSEGIGDSVIFCF